MAGNDASGTVHSATDGGVAGTHPTIGDAGVLVGPSTASEQNLVTAGLIPVACWRVDDVRFDFDSSFVLPDVAEEIVALAKLREAHKKPVVPRTDPKLPQFIFPPLSIFGHADPVGQDDYNKFLSGRRAAAIYGLLTRRDEVWEDLFSNKGVFTGPAAGDKWGQRSIQTMLTALGFPPDTSGQDGQDTTSAVRSFQSSQGLSPDGNPGQQTRKKLFLAYMDKLCGADFKLDKEDDFLARGKDNAGKGDFQGCGEFNPLLIFSDQENQKFERDKDEKKAARNAANAPNRRVMVLLFRSGSKVLASKWPCPKAKEGVAGCKKRFWSDGDRRHTDRLPDQERKFEASHDTFACRFYHRMTSNSPCESPRPSDDCFVFLKLFDDTFENVLANQSYELRGLSRGVKISATASADGIVRHENLPDDHYELQCGDRVETVEVFYLLEKDLHEGKPWFMRIRGFPQPSRSKAG